MGPTPAERAARIALLITDVDGVLTDGRLHYGPAGEIFKSFHVQDGYGLRRLLEHGIKVAVLSGRASPAVTHRMRELGVTEVHQGHREKLPVFEGMLARHGLTEEQVAYIGDDSLDVVVMRRCGLAIAVADAHADAAAAAHFVTGRPGGAGAVREVCDLILSGRERA